MAKRRKQTEVGVVTLSALGVTLGAIVDAMRHCDVPNDTVHVFLDQLDDGFDAVLFGVAREIMLTLVDILRESVPSND